MIDDLAPLFAKDPQDWGFRQGTIVAWNVFTGLSTVRVGGATLTDVPFLSQAGQVQYLPGDAVLLIRFKSSWAIVGRYVSPGGNAAIGRYFELTGAATGTVFSGFSLSTSFVTKATLDINVPVWASIATVTATLMAQAINSTASKDNMQGAVQTAGAISTTWTAPTTATTDLASVTVVGHHGPMLVTPGGTLSIVGQLRSVTGAWAANASNGALLQATVAWNSNLG